MNKMTLSQPQQCTIIIIKVCRIADTFAVKKQATYLSLFLL